MVIGPVGPEICAGVPPNSDANRPTQTAPYSPAIGPAPDATPKASANGKATIAAVSWIGAISKNLQLGQDGTIARSLLLAGCLAPTAMIGSYVGGHLTHALPLRVVRGAFIALMLLAAAKMFGWL